MNRTERSKIVSLGVAVGVAAIGAVLALPVATAAPAESAEPLPAVGTVTRQLDRTQAGHLRPTVVSGVLTAPSADALQSIGSAYLASRPAILDGIEPGDLQLQNVIDFHRGHALRYAQTYRGLPVYGGATVVRLDDQRRVRWAASDARPIPLDLDIEPTLSPRQAVAEAGRALGYDQAFIDAIDPAQTVQLAVFAQPNMPTPRLAYWIELHADMARFATYRGFVDAHTGHVYKMENMVMHGGLPACTPGSKRAYIYPENPLRTPDLECVSLEPYVAPGESQLRNDDITTGNCIDNNGCKTVTVLFSFDIHWCDEDPIAQTDGNDDFTAHVPPPIPEATDDTFSEVQMFYHLNKGFEHARSMGGFTDLASQPLNSVVNFRAAFDIADPIGTLFNQLCTGATYTGGMELLPFDNAAFVPAGGLFGQPATDSLVFGQGVMTDYAYDGDVVYHEFGHALMKAVAPELSRGYFDEYGFDPTPGGMHEGYADLMSMWVTGDSSTGEWSLGALGPQYVRDMDNNDMCPSHLVGEVHEDALPITGGIWAGREAIAANGGDRRTFDEATFAAQQLLTANDNYETAAAKTVAEVEASMGAEHAATLSQIFADRGISDCNNRIADGTETHEFMIVGPLQGVADGQFPGVIQWRYDLPGGADSITLSSPSARVLASPLGEPTASLAIKPGDAIRWTEMGMGATGDYDAAVQVEFAADNTASVTLDGPFAPGTYYLQLYAEGGAAVFFDTSISHLGGTPPTPDAGPNGPDAGPGGDVDAGGPDVDGDDAGSCGCVVGARGHSPAGALLLTFFGMIGLVWIRRRR